MDVLLDFHDFGLIAAREGRVCCAFFLGLGRWVYNGLFLVLRVYFFVGVAYFTFNIVFANTCRLFLVCRVTFGVGVVGEECVVEQRLNFAIISKGNFLRRICRGFLWFI